MKLTDQQVEQYREHGVLIAPNILTDDDFAPVIADLEAWIDKRAKQRLEAGMITDLHEGEPFNRRVALLYAQDKSITNGMDIMQMRSKACFEFLFNRNLIEAMQSLLGPEIECNPIQHLRAKMPAKFSGENRSYEGNVPWHQDAAVTWEEADNSDIITCWIPFIDANEQNGCMKIIPDIVKRGYLEHVAEGGTTVREDLLPTDVEPIIGECPKGGVIFMNKYTPHMGLSNHSDDVRWTMDLRFQKTGEPSGRPFWPSFVVHSETDPQSVQDDYDNWNQRWDESLEKSKGVAWHRTVPVEKRMPAGA